MDQRSTQHIDRWLRERAYKPSTEKIYRWHLTAFLHDHRRRKNLYRLTRADIATYIKRLQRRYHQKTVRLRISAIASFYSWATEEAITATNPATRARMPATGQDSTTLGWLDTEQAGHLLTVLQQWRPATTRTAVTIEIQLMLMHAIRAAEMCALNVSDMVWRRGPALRFTGKAGKDRLVHLDPGTAGLIDAYLSARARDSRWRHALPGGTPLLLSATGRRICYRTVVRHVHKAVTLAGLGTASTPAAIGPHALRASFALAADWQGVPRQSIQQAMGHQHYTTTCDYLERAKISGRTAVSRVADTFTLARIAAQARAADPHIDQRIYDQDVDNMRLAARRRRDDERAIRDLGKIFAEHGQPGGTADTRPRKPRWAQ